MTGRKQRGGEGFVEMKRLLKEEGAVHNTPELKDNYHWFFDNSERMRTIGRIIDSIGDADVPVLITGKTGVGKEIVARAIHYRSVRKEKPFVKINCAMTPENLIESEFFGYEKGAFTDAICSKPGRLEFAHKGTLFLDEIGNMPNFLQLKLLRVLQEGEFFRLGGAREIKIDLRIVAATNGDLEKMVKEKKFREDFFYRLNVIRIEVPPLKERKEELVPLIEYFLAKYCEIYKRPMKGLNNYTLTPFLEYSWPGNVRELENVVRRMVILGDTGAVLEDLKGLITSEKGREEIIINNPDDDGRYSLHRAGKLAALAAERETIKEVLEITYWNRRQAAGMLGVSYKTLLNKIKETGLDK
jgi:transcriptional regulator with PAS, ATPase and Fis domain